MMATSASETKRINKPKKQSRSVTSDPEKAELIKQVNKYFRQSKSFYLTCVVSSPYDGCFYEPNIFLVTPPGNKNDWEDKPLVKGLYATGQGRDCEKIETKAQIIELIREERMGMWSPTYKRIDDFTIGDATKPINGMPPHENYWAQAVIKASQEWGISLTWTCSECEREIEGDEYEGRPEPTGCHGDGGIGVIMTGCMCNECLDNGRCRHCGRDGSPEECYDPQVAKNGWSLCNYCVEKLLYQVIRIQLEASPVLPKDVCVEWWRDERQLVLPGMKPSFELRLSADGVNLNSLGFIVDTEVLLANIEDMGLEDMGEPYNYSHGEYFSGEKTLEIAEEAE